MLGISAGHIATDESFTNDIHENYCDQVAAEFLVPFEELKKIWNGNIKYIARKFCVS